MPDEKPPPARKPDEKPAGAPGATPLTPNYEAFGSHKVTGSKVEKGWGNEQDATGTKKPEVSKEVEIFWVAHVSFKLLKGTDVPTLEARKYFYAENPDFRIAYPFSWSAEAVKSDWDGVSAVDLRLLDGAGQVVLGYVQVKAQRDSAQSEQLPLAALRDDCLVKLRKSFGYVPSRPFQPLTEQDDPRAEAADGWLGGFAGEEKVSAKGAETDVAVRLGFIRRGGSTFSFIALSAPVRDDTLAAFRTQRVFEMARDTLEVPE